MGPIHKTLNSFSSFVHKPAADLPSREFDLISRYVTVVDRLVRHPVLVSRKTSPGVQYELDQMAELCSIVSEQRTSRRSTGTRCPVPGKGSRLNRKE
jgi:hypothetical protein